MIAQQNEEIVALEKAVAEEKARLELRYKRQKGTKRYNSCSVWFLCYISVLAAHPCRRDSKQKINNGKAGLKGEALIGKFQLTHLRFRRRRW